MQSRHVAPLLLLLLIPSAAGHGEDGFGHLNVDVAELTPGQTKTYHLDPSNEGGDITLSQGWVFGLYGGVEGNAPAQVSLRLVHEGIDVANWTWSQGYHGNTTRLHFTGDYEVIVRNDSNRTIRYALYYDQSCNCKGKLIPLPGGWNLFNYDLPADRDVRLGFPLARTSHARAALALLASETDAKWPQDFTILQQTQAKGPQWLNFTFKTEKAQRYYVYVEAVEGASIQSPMYLTPLLEVQAKPSPTPGLGLLILAAMGATVFAQKCGFRKAP